MQLHVKLPKGKVRDACHKAASWNASMSQREKEFWGKRHPNDPYRAAAHKLNLMASACQYSVGDIYVSSDLWAMLAPHYNHG
jgi:hypothetical protein